jgi:hypothetical protein
MTEERHDPRFDPPDPDGQSKADVRRRVGLLVLALALASFAISMWMRSAGKGTWLAVIGAVAALVLVVVEFTVQRYADDHIRDNGPYSESTKITR